ncbi:uncharacterized protein PITG_08109 [Phytophthora infestans T30-4]|uniref:Uncharacterized protein n=1 Tax=Phytophthora infestans (strain T30-4) TaxID=403677 RepID=D0N9H6_PHYIT|nr:uncharacterized protein PITG_08109 [Phytophthora infestans T30-4]EEY54464.1 hypothetical protein PITG_08109 [Phytophthora infestans T30-4]|eukprot:XP_002904286.1 hypothetical protein PITG_08109 [Phytophthora infestans T30-4]
MSKLAFIIVFVMLATTAVRGMRLGARRRHY